MVDGFLDDAIGIGFVGRVAGDGETLRAGCGDAAYGFVQGVLGPAAHRDLRAGAREPFRQGRTDRPAATRDEGDATVEAERGRARSSCSFDV